MKYGVILARSQPIHNGHLALDAIRNDLELEGLVPKCIIDAKFYLKEFILLHESINN